MEKEGRDRKNAFFPEEGETLDDLLIQDMKLLQSREGYRFSLDATLLAMWMRVKKNLKAMDLGTGSGVMPLFLAAKEETLRVDGLELQESLYKRAVRNVEGNELTERIRIFQGDICRVNEQFPREGYGLVFSNPPFFREGEGIVSPQPERAVARHELRVKLQDIVVAAAYLLKDRGAFCVILNAKRLAEFIGLLPQAGFTLSRLRMVHSQVGKPAELFLAEAVKNSPRELAVEAPLVIYEENGEYGQEILEWYGR